MNENIKVSIAGIAFTFEPDAYEVMRLYLDKLEAGYKHNPDGREIVADIEGRIAELILSEQESNTVVVKKTVDSIVAQLGFPDDMDTSEPTQSDRLTKRFYRNPDGAKLGGVCSGLGTYFNIDPVWLRVILFLPIVLVPLFGILDVDGDVVGFIAALFGCFILLYLILWICIPMARTPRQKLEMKGERITAASIHDSFSQDASAVSPSSENHQRSASVWANIMYTLGQILLFCIKAFLFVIALAFACGAVGLLVALVALLMGGTIFTDLFGQSFLPFDLPGAPVAYIVLVILAVLLFVVIVGYLLIKLIFNLPNRRKFLISISAIWVIILVFVAAMTVRYVFFFKTDSFEDCFEHLGDRIENVVDNFVDTFEGEFRNAVAITVDQKSDDKLLEAVRRGETFTVSDSVNGVKWVYKWQRTDGKSEFVVEKSDSVGNSTHSFAVPKSAMLEAIREAIRDNGHSLIILRDNQGNIITDDTDNQYLIEEPADTTQTALERFQQKVEEQTGASGLTIEPLDTIVL